MYEFPDVEECLHEALTECGIRSTLQIATDGRGGGDFARLPFVLVEWIGSEESGPFRTSLVSLTAYGATRRGALAFIEQAAARLSAQPWSVPSGVLDAVEVDGAGISAHPWPDPSVHVYGCTVAVETRG